MKSDIAIAQEAVLRPIVEIAREVGLSADEFDTYGRFKAKVLPSALTRLANHPDGKLVIVTAMTPTIAGEGKTTTTIGLGQGMARIGKRAVVTLREPAMGPVFGAKGGAAGGGYSQVVPMEDINLHFTGDFHAITSANNVLAALVDNHLQQGNQLGLDSRRITWRRCLDVNDRALRSVVIGLGGASEGVPRETGFDITPASEVMAAFCLASDMPDLQQRLGRMIVGFTRSGQPVTASDMQATGALSALLREAINPNLVQTLEGGPALVHGGPFANIAHGTNSLRATRLALKLGDYALVETGFGADLGFEKFCNIVARQSGLVPDAAVIIASVRALKRHGGVAAGDLVAANADAVLAGLPNLVQHVENVRQFGVPALVALNVFDTDTDSELAVVERSMGAAGIPYARSYMHTEGGEGGRALAHELVSLLEREQTMFRPLYGDDMRLSEKISTVARQVYRADGVDMSIAAAHDLERFEKLGYGRLPVCIAKTQYSFSDDATLLNAPRGFRVTVRSVRLSAGAGFVVALTGDIMTMPGLSKRPAAERIGIGENGLLVGLD